MRPHCRETALRVSSSIFALRRAFSVFGPKHTIAIPRKQFRVFDRKPVYSRSVFESKRNEQSTKSRRCFSRSKSDARAPRCAVLRRCVFGCRMRWDERVCGDSKPTDVLVGTCLIGLWVCLMRAGGVLRELAPTGNCSDWGNSSGKGDNCAVFVMNTMTYVTYQ